MVRRTSHDGRHIPLSVTAPCQPCRKTPVGIRVGVRVRVGARARARARVRVRPAVPEDTCACRRLEENPPRLLGLGLGLGLELDAVHQYQQLVDDW